MTNLLRPEYEQLLRDAARASAIEDDFDVNSDDAASVLAFEMLQLKSMFAQVALIAFVAFHHSTLLIEMMQMESGQ